MKLKQLLKDLPVQVKGSKEIQITGISSDSRTLFPGNLYIAKKGGKYDGFQMIPEALQAGAVAIVTDLYDPFIQQTQIIHPNSASLEALLAARYYDFPSKELFVVGATGTKGKTTTSYLIRHLFEAAGLSTGLIGTVERIIQESRFLSTLTTHDAISNQKWLREMVQKGCRAVILEVSSHGLDQGRVDEIGFDLALFTNLYPDHLDYHGTMEAYAAAKRKLFERAERSIFNADSPWSQTIVGKEGMSYGIEKGDLRAEAIRLSDTGSQFTVRGVLCKSPLLGRFNIYNQLAAIAVALDRGIALETICLSLESFPAVPARMERIGNVFVDFAHNEESLASALSTLKEVGKGRVIVVFGCGGERDPSRRSGMARAAEQWADLSIITNDNPRREEPEQIAQEIVSHFRQKRPLVELDRRRAIAQALALATPEDFVLIAGKGHERVQIFAHQTIPFDDLAVVKEILQAKSPIQ